jgi:WD40 repeat protein
MRDASTGQASWSLAGGFASIRAAFTPDGESVLFHRNAIGLELSLLRTADGKVSRPLPAPRFSITCLAVSPDGKTAVTGDQRGFVRSLDLTTGSVRFEFRADDRPVSSLVFADAGRQMVTLSGLFGGRQLLQVWDAATGVLLEPLLGGSHADRDLSVHPRSGELVSCGTTAKVWKLNSRRENLRLAVRETTGDTAFWGSEDFIFAQGSSSPVDILDLRSVRPQKAPLWEAGERQRLVTVSAEGTMAALAAPGKDATTVQILQRTSLGVEPLGSWSSPGNIAFLHMSPDGSRLLLRSSGALRVVAATTGVQQADLWNNAGAVPDAQWVGNERVVLLLAARNSRGLPKHEDRLAVHDARSGQRLLVRTSKTVINAIATSPDGQMLADAGVDRVVRLRNATTLEITREIRAHDGPIMALAFHPGGGILATASEDLTVKLWDLSSGKLIEKLQGPVGPPKTLVFSPDGKRIACLASDRTLRIWDTRLTAVAAQAGGS